MPTIKCLDLANSIINHIIVILIINLFDNFKTEGVLFPVLLACMASLIMCDQYFMTDMGPKNSIILDLREAIKSASIIDYRSSTNDPSDIMNHWGGIIYADFEWNNPYFKPLTNVRNSTQFVMALNHIGKAFSSLQYDYI